MFLRRGYFPNMRWRLPVGLARIYNAWSVTGLGKYFCGFARKASRSTPTSLVMDIPTVQHVRTPKAVAELFQKANKSYSKPDIGRYNAYLLRPSLD